MAAELDGQGGYFPYHRTDKYPRHLGVDFRKLDLTSLKKYLKAYDVHVRPDCTPGEVAVAVARHFEAHLDVDEEECIGRFMNAVKRPPKKGAPEPPKRRDTRDARRPATSEPPSSKSGTKRPRPSDTPTASGGGGAGSSGGGGGGGGGASGGAPSNKVAKKDDSDSDSSVGQADQPLYCTCKRPDYGEMIACDNQNCEIEWFHLGCVGLTNVTRPADNEKWYCLACRGDDAEDTASKKRSGGTSRKSTKGSSSTKTGRKRKPSSSKPRRR